MHHKFSETDADPHNANRGFFFSHVGWLMQRKHPEVYRKGKTIDMSDIDNDPLVQFHTKCVFKVLVYIHRRDGVSPTRCTQTADTTDTPFGETTLFRSVVALILYNIMLVYYYKVDIWGEGCPCTYFDIRLSSVTHNNNNYYYYDYYYRSSKRLR